MGINPNLHRTRLEDIQSNWHVVDASGKTLGRVCSEIDILLRGKHQVSYVPYLNTGDFVVVVNAEKVKVTGDKLNKKMYYRHSGYPGGLTEQSLEEVLQIAPTRVIEHAVKGMLPKSKLGRKI